MDTPIWEKNRDSKIIGCIYRGSPLTLHELLKHKKLYLLYHAERERMRRVSVTKKTG